MLKKNNKKTKKTLCILGLCLSLVWENVVLEKTILNSPDTGQQHIFPSWPTNLHHCGTSSSSTSFSFFPATIDPCETSRVKNRDLRPFSQEPGRGHKNISKKVLKLWHQTAVCIFCDTRCKNHLLQIQLPQMDVTFFCEGKQFFCKSGFTLCSLSIRLKYEKFFYR